jgi:hypothetical protein
VARSPRTPAHQARAALLRGLVGQHCATPDDALRLAIPEAEWEALLEGRTVRFQVQNCRKARRAVKLRHPVRSDGCG